MIPLSVPNLGGNEWKYIKDCLDTNWVSSVGSYVSRFEEMIAAYCGVKHAVATMNGTAALQLSLQLAGVERGDLVVVPNITFVASCNSILHAAAVPLLVDVDRDTWQMDLDLLHRFLKEKAIVQAKECRLRDTGQRIKAIMPVHVLGNICDMDKLIQLAAEYNLAIVEDATEALGSTWKGQHAGSFGVAGCLSFNGNKIITTGGGGMILTNDSTLAKRAKHLTTQAKASADEYYHDETGFNFRLVNILAAMGVAQMEQFDRFLERKREISKHYTTEFGDLDLQFQQVSKDVNPNNWLFTVAVPEKKSLLKYLAGLDIQARPFWVPMNQLPMHSEFLYINDQDRSGSVYEACISLPSSTSISDQDLSHVSSSIKKYFRSGPDGTGLQYKQGISSE